MKQIIFVVALLAATLETNAPIFGQTVQEYIAGQVYFKLADNFPFQSDTNSTSVNLAVQLPFLSPYVQTFGIDSARSTFYFSKSPALQRTLRLFFNKTAQINQLLKALNALPEVEYVEQVPLYRLTLTPNDLGNNSLSGQWGLYKINATAAWDLAQGYSTILVAVVDNAVQTTHPDLASKMWPGYDVADGDNNPNPPNTTFSHGTHVAGIVGAASNNGMGIASIGYNTGVMPVKATKNTGNSNSISHGYEGVVWAADHGAHIINMSWGGPWYSTTGANAISYAWSRNAILVAAAGNATSNALNYPAAYPNVISVAATDITDHVASFSTYGTWVDVSAPGVNIYSTVPTNSYGHKSGTSMATPLVAGLAGLIMSAKPIVTRQEVIDCLLQTTDDLDALNPTYAGMLGTGRINAYEAVKCMQASCPNDMVLFSPFFDWASGNHLISTDVSIFASNRLSGSATVRYYAGSWIQLKPGFSSKCASFQAKIQGCTHFSGDQAENRELSQPGVENSKNQWPDEQTMPDDGFVVFPNPTSADLNLRFTAYPDNSMQLSLTDIQGKTLRLETLAPGETQFVLTMGDLLPSVYLLSVKRNDGRMFYRKIVKL